VLLANEVLQWFPDGLGIIYVQRLGGLPAPGRDGAACVNLEVTKGALDKKLPEAVDDGVRLFQLAAGHRVAHLAAAGARQRGSASTHHPAREEKRP
jgi:hypothetical protein